MPNTKKQVAVIGAGLAGLACAHHLQTAGYCVTVFEKSRGTGGRMSTRRFDINADKNPVSNWQCDHGAQYFTARDALFIKQVDAWIAQGVVSIWSPILHSFGVKPDLQSQHAGKLTRYVGVPGMSAPARQLARDLSVRCEQRVVSIKKQADQWMLAIDNQNTLAGPFDQLVIALPAQQVDDLLAASTDVPSAFVEQARASTQQHALSPCWALMLHFAERLPLPFDAAFVNPDNSNPALSWICRDSSKPSRPDGESWLLHASTGWSSQHSEAQNTDVIRAMLAEFNVICGLNADQHVPIHASAHRWRFAQAQQSLNALGFIWQPQTGLGICGDWLNQGRVEGAWLSAYHLAQAILTGK
ncbi:MAG: FAD-dependent oxidoreductase [Pseudohongiella sp.]|nr:FAD-dependent oxidoreductase [Pseudohongiella sp.]